MRVIAGCLSVGLGALAAQPLPVLAEAPMTIVDQKAIAELVQDYKVVEPMFEAMRVVLAARGETYSPAYIQGISGAAFRIAGICPCAPTCSTAMGTEQLAKLLGYEVRTMDMTGAGVSDEKILAAAKLLEKDRLPQATTVTDPDIAKVFAAVQQIIDTVKAEVNAGRPVPVWHAFTNAEWDVVTGYDSAAGEFIGVSSYKGTAAKPARAGEARTLTTVFVGGGAAAMLIGEKSGSFDARAAEVAAIREAVRHGRDQANVDKLSGDQWVMLQGIAAYERWAKDFEEADRKRGAGDAYCWGIYGHTHAMAGPFLREIAAKYPENVQRHLLNAARCFEEEAQLLASGGSLLHWGSPEGPDAARNEAAARLLRSCARLYAMGISELENAIPLIEQ